MAKIDKDRLNIQNQINAGLKEQDRLTRNLAKVLNEQLKSSKKITVDIKDRAKFLEDMTEVNDKSLDIDSRISKAKSIAVDIEKKLSTGRDSKGRFISKNQLKTDQMINGEKLKGLKIQKFATKSFKMGDELMGGMLGKAKGFLNPWTAALAVLVVFSGKLDAIGQQFGAIGLHSSAIRSDLLNAEVEATKLGKSLEDVMTSVTTMTTEFGTAFSQSRKMAVGIIDTSVALGLSVSESAQLIGTFTTISGLSTDTAHTLAKQTTLLATASDVAPQQVLRDIAGSSETVAKFTSASGENIARAAIQARKLGIDLNTAASAAESMLDFNSAVQKSMEASVLIGREINVRKLQELSLAGDLEGVALEQRKLLGSQSDFLSMNIIQRKALAASLGLSVDQAAKMLDHEKEAITLAGQLAGQPGFDELVGEKGISTLTSLMGTLKSLGAVLTNSLGPILNFVLKLLVVIGKSLEIILEPFNAIFSAMNMGIDNSFKAPTAMARGGLVTKPTNAIIGEAGPEMVIPLNQVGNVVDDVGGGGVNSQAIVDAINSLKLTTKITNKELNIIMSPSNG